MNYKKLTNFLKNNAMLLIDLIDCKVEITLQKTEHYISYPLIIEGERITHVHIGVVENENDLEIDRNIEFLLAFWPIIDNAIKIQKEKIINSVKELYTLPTKRYNRRKIKWLN